MTDKEKEAIVDLGKKFADGFKPDMELNGSEWMIVDPFSAYLNSLGFKNTLHQIPRSEKHPQVLILTFVDGTQLIPAGEDFKAIHQDAENWYWIDYNRPQKEVPNPKNN